MHDFELERADGAEERDALEGVGEFELAGHAFLEELVEAVAEALELCGAGVVEECEALGREAGDFVVGNGGVAGDGVADEEVVVAHDAHHIAGPRLVDGLAVLGEEALGIPEADGFSGAGVDGRHVALEAARDDAEEGNAVAVLRVHVRLDFENEAREGFGIRGDGLPAARA